MKMISFRIKSEVVFLSVSLLLLPAAVVFASTVGSDHYTYLGTNDKEDCIARNVYWTRDADLSAPSHGSTYAPGTWVTISGGTFTLHTPDNIDEICNIDGYSFKLVLDAAICSDYNDPYTCSFLINDMLISPAQVDTQPGWTHTYSASTSNVSIPDGLTYGPYYIGYFLRMYGSYPTGVPGKQFRMIEAFEHITISAGGDGGGGDGGGGEPTDNVCTSDYQCPVDACSLTQPCRRLNNYCDLTTNSCKSNLEIDTSCTSLCASGSCNLDGTCVPLPKCTDTPGQECVWNWNSCKQGYREVQDKCSVLKKCCSPPGTPDMEMIKTWIDPASPVEGSDIWLYGRAKNIGNGDAPPSMPWRWRLDVNNDGSWDNTWSKTGIASPTAPTGIVEEGYQWTSALVGTHRFEVCVDMDRWGNGIATESNENNNCRTQTFTVSAAAPSGSPPSNLSVNPACSGTDSKALLKWTAGSGSQQMIKRCQGIGCSLTDYVTGLPETQSGYTDPSIGSLTENTTYRYQVCNELGCTSIQNIVAKDCSPALSVSAAANPNPVWTGQEVLCDATVSGGESPYNYSWTVPPEASCDSLSAEDITCTYNSPGNYTSTITVTDSASPPSTASANCDVEVKPVPYWREIAPLSWIYDVFVAVANVFR